MSSLSIINGRIINPANQTDQHGDVHIADGKVLAIGSAPAGFQADRTIDASGQIVCPGLVDLRVRLREPGLTNKGTIASETAAAAAGGITSLCCPPDTDPIIENTATVQLILMQASRAGKANVYPLSALTQGLKGEQLSEMRELKDAGCVGSSNALKPVKNTLVMRRALEYAASHDITVFIHPFDPWLSNGCAHEGEISVRLGLSGIPVSAETIALTRDLQLIELIGTRVHFCQLSSSSAVQLIAEAQQKGLPVTADVTAHHLHLTEMDIGYFDSNCHVMPPLRTQRDQQALQNGIRQGVLSCVVSDHQPHDSDAKLAPFQETEPGISGLETLLPLALKLMDSQSMSINEVISRLTIEPARILNIPAGDLSPGQAADVCIFNPDEYWVVNKDALVSQGKNTPFHGWELKGQVNFTVKAGAVVFEKGA